MTQSFTHKARMSSQSRLIMRSEEHTSELQSLRHLVCRLLLENTRRGQCGLRIRARIVGSVNHCVGCERARGEKSRGRPTVQEVAELSAGCHREDLRGWQQHRP